MTRKGIASVSLGKNCHWSSGVSLRLGATPQYDGWLSTDNGRSDRRLPMLLFSKFSTLFTSVRPKDLLGLGHSFTLFSQPNPYSVHTQRNIQP